MSNTAEPWAIEEEKRLVVAHQVIRELLESEKTAEQLAWRYHGLMRFDQSFDDEEAESSAAFRQATKLAEDDLTRVASAMAGAE